MNLLSGTILVINDLNSNVLFIFYRGVYAHI